MDSAVQEAKPEYLNYTTYQRLVIMSAVISASLLAVINSSIVNVAISTIMGNFGASLDEVNWVSTGYILANVVSLPMTGWLDVRLGRKRYLIISTTLFTIATLGCGLSWSLPALIFFRIVQGMGGAALMATSLVTLIEIFPPKQIGIVQAVFGLSTLIGPALGPTLGGWLIDNYSWHMIFFAVIPIGFIAIILTSLYMKESKVIRGDQHPLDLLGLFFMIVGLGSLQYLLTKGQREGWLESRLICYLIISASVGIIAFVIRELTVEYPMVNLRILKHRGFASATVVAFFVGIGILGAGFAIPLFLQQIRHYTAMQTGIIMLPVTLGSMIAMPIVGALVLKLSPRVLVAMGTLLSFTAMFMFHKVTLVTGPEHIFIPNLLRGLSLAIIFIPLSTAALIGLKGKDLSDGSGLFSLVRQLGGSAGIAYLTTFLTQRGVFHRDRLLENLSIYHDATLSRLNMLKHMFMAKGSSSETALHQAYAVLNNTVLTQAGIMSYEDLFLFIAFAMLLPLPLVFLFEKQAPGPKKQARPEAEEAVA